MKCCKRLIDIQRHIPVSNEVYAAHRLPVIFRTSHTILQQSFVRTCHACVPTCYGTYTNMATGNQQRHLDFTFSIKMIYFPCKLNYLRKSAFLLLKMRKFKTYCVFKMGLETYTEGKTQKASLFLFQSLMTSR